MTLDKTWREGENMTLYSLDRSPKIQAQGAKKTCKQSGQKRDKEASDRGKSQTVKIPSTKVKSGSK